MDTIIPKSAGLDVHKKKIMACVRLVEGKKEVRQEIKEFGTFTHDLLALSGWLSSFSVTHVAMESTGVYWKPVFNILESSFNILVVNARHIKNVPGRKTDVKDCQWIAQLLSCGLLESSFIPEKPIRELRDLTRHRTQLLHEKSRIANRVHKVLEDANIKLASVATNILGVSGRMMLNAIIHGEDNEKKLSEMAQRRLKSKIPELKLALKGKVSDHHRFMLEKLLKHWALLEEMIGELDERVQEHMESEEVNENFPFKESVELLLSIPGIEHRTAENILAETGTDMNQYPTAKHLASWAGICPGNNESAGKRKSGKTTKGNRWLKSALCQSAWAASHSKNSYFSAQYRNIAGRRGKKRAAIALGHSILVIIYYMLINKSSYSDLGSDYFDKKNKQGLTKQYVKKLEKLGHRVIIEKVAA